MTDITINEESGKTIYNVDLKQYTTDIDNNLDNVTYTLSRNIRVTTISNQFVIPSDIDSWPQIGDGWWGWATNHSIDLQSNYINFNGNQYTRIYLGNGRITLSNIGYDNSETINEFNTSPMICPLWDIQGWSLNNSTQFFGNIRYKRLYPNLLKIYILTREYDGGNTNIKDANGNIILNNKSWSTDSRQEYMVTLQLNTAQQGNITFEYGRMTPGNDFPGINATNYGSQDGIVGISYGNSSVSNNNIDYVNESSKHFDINQSIMHKFENQTSVDGTSNLANTKITFEFKYIPNGVSIDGSTFTLDSTSISSNKSAIYATNNGLDSNIALVTWTGSMPPEPEPEPENTLQIKTIKIIPADSNSNPSYVRQHWNLGHIDILDTDGNNLITQPNNGITATISNSNSAFGTGHVENLIAPSIDDQKYQDGTPGNFSGYYIVALWRDTDVIVTLPTGTHVSEIILTPWMLSLIHI